MNFSLAAVSGTQFKKMTLYALMAFWVVLTFSPALMEITFTISLILWLAFKIKTGWVFPLISRKLLIPLSGFLLLSLSSIFWSEYPPQSLRGLLKVLKPVLVFLMTWDTLEADTLPLFERTFFATAALVIADCVFQYFVGRDFLRWSPSEPSGAGGRISGGLGSYGKLASYLVCTIPYLATSAWAAFKEKKQMAAMLRLCLFLGSFLILFWTRSRGAFFAFSLGLMLVLILKRQVRILLIFAAAFSVFVLLLPKNMVIHLDAEKKEQSLVERYYLWDRALSVIKAKPLTGTGINTYAVAHQKYDTTQSWRVKNYYAHNGYLQLAAETGLPTLVCFIWFLFQYFFDSFRNPGGSDLTNRLARLGLLTGALNFLFLATVDTVLHSPQPGLTFWFLLGLQMVYCKDVAGQKAP